MHHKTQQGHDKIYFLLLKNKTLQYYTLRGSNFHMSTPFQSNTDNKTTVVKRMKELKRIRSNNTLQSRLSTNCMSHELF